MVRAIDSPMPMPSALLVKNGSKTSFNLSSGMPGPRSDTDSSANFSTREVRMLMMRFSVGVSFIASIPFIDKVQNDLLKLDAVAEDRKRIRCDHIDHFEFPANGKRRKKSDRLLHNFIEVELFQFERCLFQKAAHPPDDFGGAPVILQNIVHNILEFSDVGALRFQDRVCGFGIGQNRAQRLVDFMSD